jgi:hypothetical protein
MPPTIADRSTLRWLRATGGAAAAGDRSGPGAETAGETGCGPGLRVGLGTAVRSSSTASIPRSQLGSNRDDRATRMVMITPTRNGSTSPDMPLVRAENANIEKPETTTVTMR